MTNIEIRNLLKSEAKKSKVVIQRDQFLQWIQDSGLEVKEAKAVSKHADNLYLKDGAVLCVYYRVRNEKRCSEVTVILNGKYSEAIGEAFHQLCAAQMPYAIADSDDNDW